MTGLTDGALRIQLFQGLRVYKRAVWIEHFGGRRAASLLAYLAYYPDRRHPREELIEMLWPDEDPDSTRPRFRQVLTSLRHTLDDPDGTKPGILIADRTLVRINSDVATTDVAEFEALLKAARQTESLPMQIAKLEQATALYAGDLLPGYYEDWVTAERRRLRAAYRNALTMLARVLADTHDVSAACNYARKAIDLDPLDDEAVGVGIRVYRQAGRTAEALRLFREMEEQLWKELRILPSPHLQELLTQAPVAQVAPPMPPGLTPPVPAPSRNERDVLTEPSLVDSGVATLTTGLTPFFGRQQEIDFLTLQLSPRAAGPEPGARLVTLLGPGGSGKTRLALEVARHLASAYAGAVWFVSLAAVTDPDQIVAEIASTLYRNDTEHDDPQARLDAVLARQPVVLLLDNFEQVAEQGASVVLSLLMHSPTLRCLVTSRRALNLAGERRVEVAPLPIPDAEDEIDKATASPSVRLFVDRARNVAPDFQVTADNVRSVVELCRHLEGIPLAIELAASWVSLLDPRELLIRLSDRFGMLVNRWQDLPTRHRSLRATIEWSYNLLAPDIQSFFAQLSVFHDGWTLEAAEAICLTGAIEDSKHRQQQALTALAQLQQVSLIRREVIDGTVRLRMLETLREFAAEQLDALRLRELRERHARSYLALAECAGNELTGPVQARYYDQLHSEAANLRAAVLWCLEPDGDIEIGLRFVGALWRYWDLRGPAVEAVGWIETLVGRSEQVAAPIRARALLAAGSFAQAQYWYDTSEPWLTESLRLYAEAGDEVGRGRALCGLASVMRERGDANRARSLLLEAQTLLRANNDPFGSALALGGLGVIAARGSDLVGAHSPLEEAAALYRICGHRKGIAWCHFVRGVLAERQGDIAVSLALFQEGLSISRVLNDGRSIIFALFNIAACRQQMGDIEEAKAIGEEVVRVARAHGRVVSEVSFLIWLGDIAVDQQDYATGWDHYERALTRGVTTQSPLETLMSLTRCAHLAFALQRPEQAVCLFGAASRFPDLEFTEIPNPPRFVNPEALDTLRSEMNRGRFGHHWSRGQEMILEEAIAFVQETRRSGKNGEEQ